ncbi:MAG: amino acid permease [Candidatus Aminicenantes bacterium RBG_13_64_14]|nr:MAG: amino acid permease [Candidatus Aminicenantes bacterium RBG_13_64_14]
MNIWKTKTPAQIEEAASHTQLKKNLTAVDLAALGIGSVVGTGIFVATGQGAQLAGPGILLSFIIAAVTCGFCALTYSELACMFPVAGSTYSYSYVAFGEVIAWIIGWDLMLEYLVAASAVASGWSTTFIGLIQSAGVKLPKAFLIPPITTVDGRIVLSGGIVDVPAIIITLLITLVLYIGIRESAKINNIIVLVKIAVILLFVFLGVRHISLANLQPMMPFGWKGVMAGAAIIFFAYIGFDAVSTAAEETKNPKRDVPLGLMLCLGVVIVLYVAVAFVLTGIVPYKQIDVGNALPAALASIGIRWGGALVATGAIIGMISTLLVTLYGQIRIFMVMARDGLLPAAFAKVHPKHQTPHICTWITGIATALIAGLFPLPMIIDLCNIGTLFAFILVSVGVVVLRKTRPEVERKFKTPGVPFTPMITIAFCFYLMASLPKVTWIRFGLWMLAGLAIYFMYGVRHSKMQKPAEGN